ncbi:MAG: hypothetical protein JOZ15_08625, partial [Acidobacteria bacterium]|nr:hypothetical protein [Acidobacteriota bacterium]
PVEPLLCLFVAAAAVGSPRRRRWPGHDETRAPADRAAAPASAVAARALARPRIAWGRAFLALALAVELFIDLLHGPVRGGQTAPATAIVAAALRLTEPDEAVFDDKGDAVFRRRAFFPVLEDITREAMAQGRIADTIPEAILANHVCVATLSGKRLPPRGKRFLDANFLPVGPVRVCGKWLPSASGQPAVPAPPAIAPAPRTGQPSVPAPLAIAPAPRSRAPADPGATAPRGEPPAPSAASLAGAGTAPPSQVIRFQVEIPARYTILGGGGPARGRLDGIELTAPRELAAGAHVFEPRSPPPWALIWARAVERGFSPRPPTPLTPPRRTARR